MIEKCRRCGKKIHLEVELSEKYYCCPRCRVWVANPDYNNITKEKGGSPMAAKKEVKKKSTKKEEEVVNTTENSVKEETSAKVNKRDVRVENANKTIGFLDSLSLDDTEKRKVLNRAYSILSHKMK